MYLLKTCFMSELHQSEDSQTTAEMNEPKTKDYQLNSVKLIDATFGFKLCLTKSIFNIEKKNW